MKNVAVFGATGRTGEQVVRTALERGLSVQALVKDSSKLPKDLEHKIKIVYGDVLNVEDVRNTLLGQDAVIVALGTKNYEGPTTVMSEGLRNILAAMEALDINLVAVCLSMYLFYSTDSVPDSYQEVTTEHRRMLKTLEGCDVHWVAVNPAHITDDPPTGYTSRQGQNTMYTKISKTDLACFLVDCLSKPEVYQKSIGVASIPKR